MIYLGACKIFEKEIKKIIKTLPIKNVEAFFYPTVCWNSTKNEDAGNMINEIKKTDKESAIEVLACDYCILSKKVSPGISKIKPSYQVIESNDSSIKFNSGLSNKIYLNNVTNFYYFLTNRQIVDSFLSENAFIVTPGWLADWKTWLKEWGLNRNNSNVFFKESMKKIVLFDTLVSSGSTVKLQAFADYIKLPCEVINVGLDYFRLYVNSIISNRKSETEKYETNKEIVKASRATADYAMAMDLIRDISKLIDEELIIKKVIELFNVLFVAEKIFYVPFNKDIPGKIFSINSGNQISKKIQKHLIEIKELYKLNETDDGFTINIMYSNEKLGVIYASDFLFKQYQNQYLNLAIAISDVCALTISNARKYKLLADSKEKYKYMSFRDGLTGLYNRAYFEETLRQLNLDIQRFKPVSIISADINWLKEVNDTIGHGHGDRLIKDVAAILTESVRKTDVLARIGGDEFCIILSKAGRKSAERIAKVIKDKQEAFNNAEKNKTAPRISIALGFDTNDSSSDNDIFTTLKKSDEAMYINKYYIKNIEKSGTRH